MEGPAEGARLRSACRRGERARCRPGTLHVGAQLDRHRMLNLELRVSLFQKQPRKNVNTSIGYLLHPLKSEFTCRPWRSAAVTSSLGDVTL